jgi:ethanolamine permease
MSAPQPRGASGVTYTHAAEGYFDKRGLTRTAGFWGLWGLGVAAVVSGDFSGWNYGIGGAGWGGFLIATAVVTLMYVAMIASIGEMASALPHTGGAYSFARSAMGPWGGFVTGLAETIEYVATTAVIVYFSASYADSITDELFGLSMPSWAWWLILYALFLLLNIAGAEVSFRFAVVVAVLSLAVIVLFAVMALFSDALDFGKLFDIEPTGGNSDFVPFGWWEVVLAMPFAMWLYLGIEELPLAAEESHMPARDIPRAGIWGLITLIVSGGLVLLLNPAVVGASAIGDSGEPLLDGFRAILPNSDVAAVLSLFALIGLFASLQGIMYAYGRNIYSLSRAGYYPKALSLTGTRKTPWVALVVGAGIGFLALIAVEAGGDTAGDVVLNIAVWGAVIAYLLQMVSFVQLRRRFPHARRPYRSPFGVPGAVFAGAIAALIFVGVMLNEDYRPAIIAIAIVFVVGLAAFATFGRHRLVLSPEEEYAMSGGLHGDPQEEGYGAIDVADIDPEARSRTS